MAKDAPLTDEYVAGLLAKDAKASIKYSALGLEDLAPSKPPSNKPKPNTRFLRNIIKDTDSHNAALLAKEAADSRARLRSLAANGHKENKVSRTGEGDIRKRQLGDIAAILGGAKSSKRKRTEDRSDKYESRRRKVPSEDGGSKKEAKDERKRRYNIQEENEENGPSRDYRRRHRRRRSVSVDSERDGDERKKRRRSRSRSPRDHRERHPRVRQRSPRRKRSRSPGEYRDKSHKSRRSFSAERRSPKKELQKSGREDEHNAADDSDPLDDIIGPAPPPKLEVRSRGRGIFSRNSGIDSRFSADYDPTVDVQVDVDEENDWDQALEALRDRQKWKQQGADRLRAAGFTDDEIQKWEKGGEKREEDVRWAKEGEKREWDRGKVMNDDGMVVTEPSFGRLKAD